MPLNRMRTKIKIVEPEQDFEASDGVYKHVANNTRRIKNNPQKTCFSYPIR
jgi:uncharacterized protein YktB (UPF0637 family)